MRYAALADHRRLDGWPVFKAVFERHGGIAIPGVELDVRHDEREFHLLAYGFEPAAPALKDLLRGMPSAAEAIRIVHDAGGAVYLAHPYVISRDPLILEPFIAELRNLGLDGIEAVYAPYDDAERAALLALADRLELAVSGGSDFHGPSFAAAPSPGVEMDDARWRRFRAILPAFRRAAPARPAPSHDPDPPVGRWFLLHILLPALLAIALFVSAFFVVLLPTLEENIMARKREMIRELTNSAWSILAAHDADARVGRLSFDEARQQAREEIRHLRYGPEGKDYFWITDTSPRMVMHPWRNELEGRDLSDFRDPDGVSLFVEFARLAESEEHGYLDYIWQWKDDPNRLEPKEAYVRIYRPWGWVIGTGIYIEDVEREIEAITRRMIDLSASIAILIGLILVYIIHQSYRVERRRRRAESDLRASQTRYRLLVEASTEGTLMILDGRCVEANPTFLAMAGHDAATLPFLGGDDLFPPPASGGEGLTGRFEREENPSRLSTNLRRPDGRNVPVLVTPTRIELAGRRGWILVVREEGHPLAATGRRDETTGFEALFAEPAPRLLQPIVERLIKSGIPGSETAGIITDVAGAVARRAIARRIAEIGPAPVPFAFLVFGSEARRERMLLSDQDNGIVHADPPPRDAKRIEEYFRRLGIAVCDDLERAGYVHCRGESMARHPDWRRSLSGWAERFQQWIRLPNPEELLHFSVFFDLRAIDGDPSLAATIRHAMLTAASGTPAFLFHLAGQALRGRPPLRMLGGLETDDPTGESGALDLKEALQPIVGFARLYALRHQIEEIGTLARLRTLENAGILKRDFVVGIAEVFESLLQHRLRHQASAPVGLDERNANRVLLVDLDHATRADLEDAFRRIEEMRRRIEADYPGADRIGT